MSSKVVFCIMRAIDKNAPIQSKKNTNVRKSLVFFFVVFYLGSIRTTTCQPNAAFSRLYHIEHGHRRSSIVARCKHCTFPQHTRYPQHNDILHNNNKTVLETDVSWHLIIFIILDGEWWRPLRYSGPKLFFFFSLFRSPQFFIFNLILRHVNPSILWDKLKCKFSA